MIPYKVHHKEMVDAILLLDDKTIKGASLYPFFRWTGEVEKLMLILPDDDNIYMIPYKKGIVTVSFSGKIRLALKAPQLALYAHFSRDSLKGLYHYDSKWRLSDKRFEKCPGRDVIMKSNCADFITENIEHLRFMKDLSELKSVALKARGIRILAIIPAAKLMGPVHEKMAAIAGPPFKSADSQWILDPIWNFWSSE